MRLQFVILVVSGLLFARCSATAQPSVSHLVFEGGGVRGIAYTGALQVLEDGEVLANVETTSGTSVGGLIAVLYAVGYTPRELMGLLAHLKIQQFNDGRWVFIGGFARTFRRYGWYRGERFENWVADAIERKTGRRHLTFGELHAMRAINPRYKDPTVFGADLTLQRTVQFSHVSSPEMPLHLATRITMSVPLYFGAVFLDSNMTAVRKPMRGARYQVLVDGGIAANYPIAYYRAKDSSVRVLGLKLERPEQIVAGPASSAGIAPYRITSLWEHIASLYNFAIETANPDPVQTRQVSTIYISTEDIGPRVRKMKQHDLDLLVESGRKAARLFIKQHSLTQ